MIESADYEVIVTITFSTIISFSPIERDGPITSKDALDNFYGLGLSEVFDSGEYGHDIEVVHAKKIDA